MTRNPQPEIAAEIVAGAQYLGSSVLLAQGAGGNNSVKDLAADTLWIKASGITLSQNSTIDAFVALALCEAKNILRDPALRSLPKQQAHELSVQKFVAAVRSQSGLRPSLETGMHVSLPHRVVVHTHAVYINGLSCMIGGSQIAAAVLPRHDWIPYATPGFDLALAMEKFVHNIRSVPNHASAESPAIILENHGFVSAAASTKEAIAISEKCVAAARDFFGPLDSSCLAEQPPSPDMLALAHQARQKTSTHVFRPGRFALFRSAAHALRGPALHAFVPDDVVYLGPQIWRAASASDAPALLDQLLCRFARFSVLAPDQGMLFAAENEALLDAMEEAALAHVLIALLISRRGVPQPMTAQHISELMEMESEKYRRSIAAKPALESA